MRDVNVGVIGLGNVGGGTVSILIENADSISMKLGFRLRVASVCSRHLSSPILSLLPSDVKRTSDWRDVVQDPGVDVVAELVGGTTTADQIIDASIAAGKSVAVVSDAGTPGLSDPGFRVVRACRRRNLPVVPVPGASALTAVLSAAGLPTNGFLFAGFLPAKSAARIAFLQKYSDFDYTLALYESCHRIDKFAGEIDATLGPERVVCIAKEITKLHETFFVGGAADVSARLAKASLKGEFVVLIAPKDFVL